MYQTSREWTEYEPLFSLRLFLPLPILQRAGFQCNVLIALDFSWVKNVDPLLQQGARRGSEPHSGPAEASTERRHEPGALSFCIHSPLSFASNEMAGLDSHILPVSISHLKGEAYNSHLKTPAWSVTPVGIIFFVLNFDYKRPHTKAFLWIATAHKIQTDLSTWRYGPSTAWLQHDFSIM